MLWVRKLLETLENSARTVCFLTLDNSDTGTNARFHYPWGVALDSTNGLLYVSDQGFSFIRCVHLATRNVWTIVGGTVGSTGSFDGIGTGAAIYNPRILVIDAGHRQNSVHLVEGRFHFFFVFLLHRSWREPLRRRIG